MIHLISIMGEIFFNQIEMLEYWGVTTNDKNCFLYTIQSKDPVVSIVRFSLNLV